MERLSRTQIEVLYHIQNPPEYRSGGNQITYKSNREGRVCVHTGNKTIKSLENRGYIKIWQDDGIGFVVEDLTI